HGAGTRPQSPDKVHDGFVTGRSYLTARLNQRTAPLNQRTARLNRRTKDAPTELRLRGRLRWFNVSR
ncbi:hypothetical protein SAMN02745244_03610, partial [Tessaracoccus bendigoensis DSM 12906]